MQQIQYDVRPGEFADAMKSTQTARMIFWLLLGLALIYQLVSFSLVEFGGVLDTDGAAPAAVEEALPGAKPAGEPKTPATPPPAKAPEKKAPPTKPAPAAPAPAAKPEAAAKPAASPAAAAEAHAPAKKTPPTKAEKWHDVLRWSLPAAKFLAMVCGMLLALTLLFAVGLSLIGKLGGMAGMISGFFWSLILFVMVVPWQQVLVKSDLACGALYSLGDLLAARQTWATDPHWRAQTLYYGRFVVYPGVALLIWLIVHVKFTCGVMRMTFPHALPAGIVAVPQPAPQPAVQPASQPAAKEAKPAKPLALKSLDEKTQGGTGRAAPPADRPMGALTERLFKAQAESETDEAKD